MVAPCFPEARFQEMFNQPDEAVVVDVFTEYPHEHRTIDSVEERANVAFDEPLDTPPVVCNLLKSRVTPSSWAKAVGVWAELWLIVGLKDRADDFLKEFVRP